MPTKTESETLDRAFAALADPTRREIIVRLSSGEATVSELAAPFPISLPAISKHIRVLERAGLIEQRKQAQQRPCRIVPERLRLVNDWLEQYEALWSDRLDRLSVHLKDVQDKSKE
jgi:DNA-binding transcriptional ArsR family regulator